MGFLGNSTGVDCHFLLQGNLPDPGIEPRSPTLQADALPSEPPGKPQESGGVSQVALAVRTLPAAGVRHTGLIPGWEDPLEEGMAPHSSIPARRVPWTEEPGGL